MFEFTQNMLRILLTKGASTKLALFSFFINCSINRQKMLNSVILKKGQHTIESLCQTISIQ